MKINRMTVTNLRALEHAEFEFDSQITLIVGVNGVGKSTLLDALRVCSSRILLSITQANRSDRTINEENRLPGRFCAWRDMLADRQHIY